MNLVDILTRPALNGLYRLDGVQLPSLLDARALDTRERLLAAIGHALDFPEYYGQNWDALEECLNDMSWRDGPILLCIEHAKALPADTLATLKAVFADAAEEWRAQGRVCSLLLSGLDDTDLPPARA